MNAGKRITLTLAVPAAIAVAVLLATPRTSWIVRNQAVGQFGPMPAASEAGPKNAIPAHEHPGDLEMQIAAIHYLTDESGIRCCGGTREEYLEDRTAGLESLETSFGNRPEVDAAVLRTYLVMDGFSGFAGLVGLEMPQAFSSDHEPTGEELAAFDRAAAAGERADPDNTFFPYVRTIGLFLSHQDDAARAVLHRAAGKPHWRDYMTDLVRGNWKLREANAAVRSGLGREWDYSVIQYPHYAILRDAARLFVLKAVKAEEAGRTREGWAIRRDLIRCGGILRADSDSLVGANLGLAFVGLGMESPGGAVGPKYDTMREIREDAMTAYLARTGITRDIPIVQEEAKADRQVHAMFTNAWASMETQRIVPLLKFWVAGMVVLGNCLWLVVLGVIAFLCGWSGWLREGKPMARWAFWATTAGVCAAAGFLIWNKGVRFPGHPDPGTRYMFDTGLLALGPFGTLISIAALLAIAGALATRYRALGLGLMLTAATGVLTLALISIFLRQLDGLNSLVTVYSHLTATMEDPQPRFSLTLQAGVATLLSSAAVLLFGVRASLKRGIPLSVGVERQARVTALPLACAGILMYGYLVFGTASQERVVQAALDWRMQHEGVYYAQLVGKQWPGPVKWE